MSKSSLALLCNAHYRFCHTRPSAQWLAHQGGFNEDGVSEVIGLRHTMMRFGRSVVEDEIRRRVEQGNMNVTLANMM